MTKHCSYCANMLHFDKDFLGLEQWGKNLQSSTVIFVAGAVCRADWAAGQQRIGQVKICELTDGRKQISHSMHMSALEHIKQDVGFRVSSSV